MRLNLYTYYHVYTKFRINHYKVSKIITIIMLGLHF